MVKKIFKYGTGEAPPVNAVYLNTVRQTKIYGGNGNGWKQCWLVWHYFLVEVEE